MSSRLAVKRLQRRLETRRLSDAFRYGIQIALV